jgi:hypothetical protein
MSNTIAIRHNHLHHNGINYLRGNASEVMLGDVGEKKAPSPQTNYLQVLGHVPRTRLKIHSAARVDLRGVAIGSADIGGCLQVPGRGEMTAGAVATALNNKTLSLLKLSVLPKDIVAAANAAHNSALAPLKQADTAGRLVHQVFVILETKTAAMFHGATGFEARADLGPLTVTAKGGLAGSSGSTITVAPGSVFAYLLLTPGWGANLKQDWKFIKDSQDDRWSLH